VSAEADVAVVGGGVVGLACAAALAAAGRSVCLLERRSAFALEGTTHSSEVVHAGLYYPEGSRKAVLCVRGRELLYERCARLRIPHRVLGKLVVAVEAGELAALEALAERGRHNGAPGLEILSGRRVRELEPWVVAACAALHSPRTGIVDAHALALSYAAEAEAAAAALLVGAEVVGLAARAGGFELEVRRADGAGERLRAAAVVNAAGLGAEALARAAGLDLDACGYRIHLVKGSYFALAPGAPLRLGRLVYPLPAGPGLGIHATLDLGGRLRFGPDAEPVAAPDYGVDPGRADAFVRAVRRYLPACEPGWLAPESAGVRTRRARPDEPFADFAVAEESARGLPGLVNLIGIDSPGLTAAPALAEEVARLLGSL
jgi:D-amino-acid oxidase